MVKKVKKKFQRKPHNDDGSTTESSPGPGEGHGLMQLRMELI